MSDRVLVTGAGGYLGFLLVERLARAGTPVIAWVHAKDVADLDEKKRALAGRLPQSVGVMGGELSSDDAFRSIDPREVTALVHCAAVTRFNVPRDLAEAVNVRGAERAFRFAAACPRLERLVFASTLYACGLVTGHIEEAPLLGRRDFANHYERSKWEAEALLLRDFGGLPWSIARVATVLADDETGRVGQQNAVHNTLRLLFYGLLSLVPGDPAAKVPLVTGEFAAGALEAALRSNASRDVLHVCHDSRNTLTLGELLEAAMGAFAEDASYRKRGLLPPLFCDLEAFDLLERGAASTGSGALSDGLGSVAPFARQLFAPKTFANDRLRSVFDAPEPNTALLAQRALRWQVRTRWGKEPNDAER